MDVEKIIDLLREALEEKDWELIKELINYWIISTQMFYIQLYG